MKYTIVSPISKQIILMGKKARGCRGHRHVHGRKTLGDLRSSRRAHRHVHGRLPLPEQTLHLGHEEQDHKHPAHVDPESTSAA